MRLGNVRGYPVYVCVHTFGLQVGVEHQVLAGLHQMVHEVLAVLVGPLPVLDGLPERVPEERDRAVRVMVHPEDAEQRRLHEYDGHSDLGPERRLEHGLAVFPELRVRVVDGVQLEPERAATDHVGRVLGHHVADLDPVGHLAHRPADGRQQAVRALLHLVRCERRVNGVKQAVSGVNGGPGRIVANADEKGFGCEIGVKHRTKPENYGKTHPTASDRGGSMRLRGAEIRASVIALVQRYSDALFALFS